jgi:hypothetical protein
MIISVDVEDTAIFVSESHFCREAKCSWWKRECCSQTRQPWVESIYTTDEHLQLRYGIQGECSLDLSRIRVLVMIERTQC